MEELPWWLSGNELACQCRRHGFHPQVRKIPWRRKWQPTPVFLPEKFHGRRSLEKYNHKESDMTERTGSEGDEERGQRKWQATSVWDQE